MKKRFFSKNLLSVTLIASLLVPACVRSESKQKVFTAYDAQAKALLSKMTLEEKVGQMCQPDQAFLKDLSDIETYHLGSLLSGGGSGPTNDYTLKGWTDMVDAYQKHATNSRLGIPLIYGVDAVHGHNNIPGATVFPHNIGLGCANNPRLIEKIEQATAEEVRATGINYVFAPCVAVARDQRWGRTYESYSEDPETVKTLGAAAVRGFQGKRLSDPRSVAACSKHFLADGGTKIGTGKNKDENALDQGDSQMDEAQLRQIHLQGYLSTINEGVATVMPSYSSWNGVKCSAQKYLLTDLLKKELGFEGFVISDYNAIDQVDTDYKKCIEICINAGIDMVMLTDKYTNFCTQLKELVQEGKVPMSRVDDAVVRILRVKYAMGLMDKKHPLLADRDLHKQFGSAAHRKVARQAVRESLVLLKNDQDILPLKRSLKRVHVAGLGADNLGMQCGGWTIGWQGALSNSIPGGTTILQGIKNTVSKRTQVTYTVDGTGAEGADVGIVVIGEKPYAEFMGDTGTLTLDRDQDQTFQNMKKAGIPLVVVLLSGREVILGDCLAHSEAFLAAWLPGSEGQGVADVLFGAYKPTGKLSHSWPRLVSQLPLNIGDKVYDPLFPFGYGLSYK